MNTNTNPSIFKQASLELVSRSQKDSAPRTMRATASRAMSAVGDSSYQFDSVDDTLDFCYSFDSNESDSRS